MSSSVKWLVAGLVAALLCFGGGFLLSHHQDGVTGAQRQAHADSLAAAQQRVTDTLRLRAVADSIDAVDADARAHAATAIAEHYRQAASVASSTARAAVAQLDSLHTAADSLVDYRDDIVPAQAAVIASDSGRIVALDSARRDDSTAYQRQLVATARLESIVRGDSTLIRQLRDSLGKPVAVPLTSGFGGKVLSTGETAGAGLATVYACSHGASVGCIAGALTTLIRAKPWRLVRKL